MLVKIDDLFKNYEGSQFLRRELAPLINKHSQNGYINMLDLCDHIDAAKSLEILYNYCGTKGKNFVTYFAFEQAKWAADAYNNVYPDDDRVSHLITVCEQYMNGDRLSSKYIENANADVEDVCVSSSGSWAQIVKTFAEWLFDDDPFPGEYLRVATASFIYYSSDPHECEQIARKELKTLLRKYSERLPVVKKSFLARLFS